MAWVHWNAPIPMPSDLMPVYGEVPRAVAVGEKIYFFKYGLGTQQLEVIVMDTRDFVCTSITVKKENVPRVENLEDPTPFAAVAIKHMIYLCGGDGASPPFGRKVWCFNTLTLDFHHVITKGYYPVCAKWKALCPLNDKIYMCPHYVNYYVYELDRSMYTLDVTTMEWNRVCTNIWPSGYQPDSIVAVGTILYIMLQNFLTYQHFYLVRFDTETEVWENMRHGGTIPRPGYLKAAFTHSGNIYMMLRCPDFSFPAQKPMKKYNIEKQKWVKGALQGREVLMFTFTTLVGDKIFFFDFYRFKVMYVYDFLPSLRSLCIDVVREHRLDTKELPKVLQDDVEDAYEL